MNFADEYYVRVYTRKTITTKRLGWEGRTVLWHLMCECDRAGILEVGDGDLCEALTVLLGDVPEEVIKAAIPRLESQGVTVRHGTKLVIVRFIEAQEAKRSDKVRAQEHRARVRAGIVTKRDDEDTQRDDVSRPVTARHETSLSLPSTVLSSAGGSASAPPPAKAPVKLQTRQLDPLLATFSPPGAVELHAFEAWATAFGRTGVVFDSKRAACLADRVRDGMTAEDADDVIAGALADPWHNGEKDGEKRAKLTTLFGDVERFEELRDKGKALRERPSGTLRKVPSVAERQAADASAEAARRAAKGLEPLKAAAPVDLAKLDALIASVGRIG